MNADYAKYDLSEEDNVRGAVPVSPSKVSSMDEAAPHVRTDATDEDVPADAGANAGEREARQAGSSSKVPDAKSGNAITETPIDTLMAITRTPLQLVHQVLTGNETSKHAKEISDIIGVNLKQIVKKFFKIANEALDNLNTINNAGLVAAIVQLANFMTRVHSTFQNYADPNQWQETLSLLASNLPSNLGNLNIRLPLNLRSPNANHEQIFDDYL